MGLFDFLKGAKGKDPQIVTKPAVDPLKQAVASPLSSFLASRIGQGLPRYPGEFASLDPGARDRFNEFVDINASDYFQKNVAAPATKLYKEEFLPVIREGFAGSLRGSGRFRAEEAGINEFSEALSRTAAEFVPQLNLQQVQAGLSVFAADDLRSQHEYQDWWASLPENNPVVSQGLQFLGNSTSTGATTLAALDPGQKGWFGDLLQAGAMIGSAFLLCWVASELFGGWFHPKTIRARAFVMDRTPRWFRRAYAIHGQSIATFIHKRPIFRFLVLPIFELFSFIGGKEHGRC